MKDATLSGLSVASVCGIGEKPSPSISWSSIPGIYDCARVHLCQPPFNFLDKCAVRDAVPIHNGNSYIVIAPGGTKLNNKIIRVNDSSDKRYIRSQVLREPFLRSAHDFSLSVVDTLRFSNPRVSGIIASDAPCTKRAALPSVIAVITRLRSLSVPISLTCRILLIMPSLLGYPHPALPSLTDAL